MLCLYDTIFTLGNTVSAFFFSLLFFYECTATRWFKKQFEKHLFLKKELATVGIVPSTFQALR